MKIYSRGRGVTTSSITQNGKSPVANDGALCGSLAGASERATGSPAATATATATVTVTAPAATTAATTTAAAAVTIATATASAATTSTTVAAAIAAATATAAATSTTAASATAALLRFVDVERAAIEHRPVHFLHRLLRVGFAAEGNETEAAAATRITVIDDLGVLDRTELLERSSEPMVIGVPAEAAHKKLLRHL
jgi:hypothetical protein